MSVAYLAVLPELGTPVAGTDAAEASWHPVDAMLARRLPFDHHDILTAGVERARSKLEYTPIATAFAGETFTIAELRRVYEIIWGRQLDAGNFHRKVRAVAGFVEAISTSSRTGRGRPAAVYRSGAASSSTRRWCADDSVWTRRCAKRLKEPRNRAPCFAPVFNLRDRCMEGTCRVDQLQLIIAA